MAAVEDFGAAEENRMASLPTVVFLQQNAEKLR